MKQLTIFRILSFILVPVAALFGVSVLVALFLFGGSLLIPAFLFSCFVIYTFASLNFLSKGIDTGRPLKPGTRDWIRVNAYVCVVMSVMYLLSALRIFTMNDAELRPVVDKMMEINGNMPRMLNTEFYATAMKIALGFMAILSIVLLVHIRLNFRLMRQYRHLFEAPKD